MSGELTREVRQQFFDRLKAERDATVARIGEYQTSLKDGDSLATLSDEGDVSQHLEARTYNLAELKRCEQKLRQIVKALANFNDDFGYCTACGDDMDLRRLNINPALPTCVTCQEAIEIKGKHVA